ncbi:SURF1 family protein [Streptomyces sp. TP-A0874]|uniref:SURF1 family protein n=1 Tax=Streptomyces sp. TP-A0874 TaxID=549819 RepID=UPI0008539FCA|nr:SURF1 family protein [Streptomyces sp. TP-A0874]
MYRFLLTPRWWGINVFAVLAIPFCLLMGSWQLGRFEARVDSHQEQQAQQRDTTAGAERPARPLTDLLPVTHETSGRLATATGRYGDQMLVPDRWLDDEQGFYVLALLRTTAGDALPVVRGWLPGDADSAADTASVPELPRGEVTVTGALQASENESTPGAHTGGGLPAGQLGMISASSLVNLVPYGVYDGWVTLSEGGERSAGGQDTGVGAAEGLRAVPPAAAPGSGLDLKAFQNLGYTGEWFVFAGFVVFMWFRFFRREVENARDRALGIPRETDAPEGRVTSQGTQTRQGPETSQALGTSQGPESSQVPAANQEPGTAPVPGA